MSIVRLTQGNMFNAGLDALVNPVNCRGIHGKGLALEFKKRWPGAVQNFTEECRLGQIEPGFVWNEHVGGDPRFLLFFPTKDHWRDPSRLEYIQSGLEDLIEVVQELQITSVGIPALGCGLGGLDWKTVFPLILAAAHRMLVRVDIFEPQE